MIEESYIDEYAPVAPTTRLSPWPLVPAETTDIAAWLPEQPLPMLIALLVIVAGAAKLGWEARALFGPVWDQRGWGALLVFAVMGSVYMVNYSNRKG